MATKNDHSAKHVIDESQYNFLKENFCEFIENGYYGDIKVTTSKDVNYEKKIHSIIFECFSKLSEWEKEAKKIYDLEKALLLQETTDMIECLINLLYFGKCIVPVTALPQFMDLANSLKVKQISVYDERGSDYFIYLMYHKQKLLDYLCYLKKNGIDCDMNIVSLDLKHIPVHSAILAAYCKKFHHCFRSRMKETNPVLLLLPFTAEIIELTLELCYYGQVTFVKSDSDVLTELAVLLGMARFLKKCKLIRKKLVLNYEGSDFRLVIPPENSKPEIADKIKKDNSQHYVYMWNNDKCYVFPFLCIRLMKFLNSFDEMKKSQFDIIVVLKNIPDCVIKMFISSLFNWEFKNEIKVLIDLFGLEWPTGEKEIPSSESYMAVKNEIVSTNMFATTLDDLQFMCEKIFEEKCNEGERIIQLFTCQTCGEQFLNCKTYKSHYNKHFSSGYLCEVCGQFVRPNTFLDHSARHKALETNECRHCEKQFISAQALKNHQQYSSCIVEKCLICNRPIGNLKMNEHIAQHNLDFQCPYCKKKLASNQWLKRHIIYQTLPRPVSCANCRKDFSFKCQLKKHIHKEHMPVSCSICSRSFKTKGIMNKHFTIKHRKDLIKCCVCNEEFTSPQELKAHERCHSCEEPYKRKFCHETFDRSDSIQNHVKQVHEKRKYICPICGKDFVSSSYFFEHGLINHHQLFDKELCMVKESDIFPWTSQNIPINTNGGRNKKIRLQNDEGYRTWLVNKNIIIYNCPICKSEFKNFSDLIFHLDKHLLEE